MTALHATFRQHAFRWCRCIAWDVFMGIAFWRGCLLGETGWLNLFTFVIWLFIVGGVLILFIVENTPVDYPPGLFQYALFTDLALIAALVWIGWFWMAGALLGLLIALTWRTRGRKK